MAFSERLTKLGVSSSPGLVTRLEVDAQSVTSLRRQLKATVPVIGPSPRDIQVAFLKGLLQNPPEAAAFTKDPVQYSISHGVLLDPEVVQTVTNVLMFDSGISDRVLTTLPEAALQDILDLRSPGVAAWPAAVAAIAAVVGAAAAVVTAVTAVLKHQPEDIMALKGLGPDGIRIPGQTLRIDILERMDQIGGGRMF
jgi:hypothetical protein